MFPPPASRRSCFTFGIYLEIMRSQSGIAVCTALALALGPGRALALPVNTLTECEKRLGFELLFDGTRESFASHFVEYQRGDSTGDPELSKTWVVEAADSALHSGPIQPDLRSREKYADFDLRLEYRNDGAAGIFYRGLLTGDHFWETGAEFMINDGSSIRNFVSGSVYDLFPASVIASHGFGSGEWDRARIVAVGDSVEHWMNGALVAAFRYHSEAWWTAVDKGKWTGFPGFCVTVRGDRNSSPIRNGYLGLQGDWGGRWSVRTMRVKRNAFFYDEAQGCPGPTAVRPVPLKSGRADSGLAVMLRRTAAGLTLDLSPNLSPNQGGAEAQTPQPVVAVLAVHLLSLDGRLSRSARLAPGARTVVFPGTYARGLYWVGIRTNAGVYWRKSSLI